MSGARAASGLGAPRAWHQISVGRGHGFAQRVVVSRLVAGWGHDRRGTRRAALCATAPVLGKTGWRARPRSHRSQSPRRPANSNPRSGCITIQDHPQWQLSVPVASRGRVAMMMHDADHVIPLFSPATARTPCPGRRSPGKEGSKQGLDPAPSGPPRQCRCRAIATIDRDGGLDIQTDTTAFIRGPANHPPHTHLLEAAASSSSTDPGPIVA